jgi:hypothetical protein
MSRYVALLLVGLSLACRDAEQASPPPRPVATPTAPPVAVSPPPAKPFSEDTRKAVFQEVLRAEARANQEALAANPDSDSVGTSTNPEKMVRRVQKRSRLAETLQQRYKGEIATRYGLSDGELVEIINEGRAKGWPPPSAP